MFIATQATTNELRQEFHVPLTTSLHFTPDGVSGPLHVITINIALLTERNDKTSVCREADDSKFTITSELQFAVSFVGQLC